MKIAIFGNFQQGEKSPTVQRVINQLLAHDVMLALCVESYDYITQTLGIALPRHEIVVGYDFTADVALSIGGDGTFLKAAMWVGSKEIPILGINRGRLGFLADVQKEEVETVIDDLFAQRYTIEERTLLQLETDAMPEGLHPFALNEIAVLKRDSASMIAIHTYLGERYLNTYQADGLIVATPTGSTAYSLSVGGPIIDPSLLGWTITPIAPHSLNVRPLVVKDSTEIVMEVESRSDSFLVSVDGRSAVLGAHQRVTIRKAPYTIKVIKSHNHLFYDTLRNKLMWGADMRTTTKSPHKG